MTRAGPRPARVEIAVAVRCAPRARASLERELRRAVAAACAVGRRAVPSLSIAVVGDRRMRRLNRDYHGVDSTTDVLAFPLADERGGADGEIVVCAAVARREARRRGLDPTTELLLYAVHGTLHLLGEDDRARAAARRMRRLETAALARIGRRLPPSHLAEWAGSAPH